MCLYVNETITRKFKKRKTKSKKVTVYKLLKYDTDTSVIVTPYLGKKVKSGWFVAKGKLRPVEIDGGLTIDRGAIHVLQRREIGTDYNPYLQVKSWAYRKDLIAVGQNNDLAFKKIYIRKNQLYAAIDVYNGV